jgi:catechol 2,3-dioxygenase
MTLPATTSDALAGLRRARGGEVPTILRLGHVDLGVRDLGEARAFYVDVLGLVEVESTPGKLYLRASEEFDLWSLSLTERDEGGCVGHMAFRLEDPDELEAMAGLHEDLGLPVVRTEAGEEPGQGASVRVMTPDGFPVEFYHHMDQIPVGGDGRMSLPMRSPSVQGGVRPLRLDHVNIRPASMDDALRYWVSKLGFSISEWVERDGRVFAAWTRRTTGNHDVALMLGEASSTMHHVAYLLPDAHAVLAAADVLADAGHRDLLDYGPGRHGLSNALYLYVRDPSGNRIELYTGDYQRDLDMEPICWPWEDYDDNGRLWWRRDMPDRFREVVPVGGGWPAPS